VFVSNLDCATSCGEWSGVEWSGVVCYKGCSEEIECQLPA